ncbi:Ig-like domain-containing protein, partial [Acinetobacter sp. YH12117]|uniref:Ig-like domain-containing protein n=1 Tax=Acinetobacter sp. YH12117 TaxID=2601104 RepID=UPI0015D2DFF1
DGDALTVVEFVVDGIDEPVKAGETAEIPGVGTLTISPEGELTFTPEPGYAGKVPDVTYTVTDGQTTDEGTVTFTDVPEKSGATATLVELVELSGSFDSSLPGLSEVYKDQNGNYDIYDEFSVNLGLQPEQKELLAQGKLQITAKGPNGEVINVSVAPDGVVSGKLSDLDGIAPEDLKVTLETTIMNEDGSVTTDTKDYPITVTPVDNVVVKDYAQIMQDAIDKKLAEIETQYVSNGNPQPTYNGDFHNKYLEALNAKMVELGYTYEWQVSEEIKKSLRQQVWDENPDLLLNAFKDQIVNSIQGDQNAQSSGNNISDIHIVDIDAYLKFYEAGLSNKLPVGINGIRGTASDWIIFDKPFDSDHFIIKNKMTNPGNTNFFDSYEVIYKDPVTSKEIKFIFNNVQGVAFSDGTVITANADGVITSYKNFSMTLSSVIFGEDVDGKQLGGLKFSSAFIDQATVEITVDGTQKSVKPEIYLNDELLIAKDGWYVLTDEQAALFKSSSFDLTVKVPSDLYKEGGKFTDSDAFKKAFEDFLNNPEHLEPLLIEPVTKASMMRMTFDDVEVLEVDDSAIFKVLNHEFNLNQQPNAEVDQFNLGSDDSIDISSLLSDDATDANLAEFVTVEYDEQSEQAMISIDRDGKAETHQSQHLVTLLNQPTAFDLEQLLQNNQIIY